MPDISEQILKEITKEYGEDILVGGQSIVDNEPNVISLSPALDIGLGGGIPEGTWVTMSGKPKVGKAQPLSAIIYTPDGPIYMGGVQPGQSVSTPDGGTTKVTGVFPQGEKLVYRVFFRDGDYADCCADHLWLVKQRHCKAAILPLKEIIRKGLTHKNGRLKWSVPVSQGCFYQEQKVPIDPYVLGVLIGDGCLSDGDTRFSTADQELIDGINAAVGPDYEVRHIGAFDYRIALIGNYNKNKHALRKAIKILGLSGTRSREKFIPSCYLVNSYDVRWAILQGLMDTDGTADKGGTCSFSTTSWKLALDVKELAQSLGFLCDVRRKNGTYKGERHTSFICNIRGNDLSLLFRLTRKRELARVRTKGTLTRKIARVVCLGPQPVQCISVASGDGLYLTDNHVVTHNTTTALRFAAQCQKAGLYVYYHDVECRLKKKNLAGTAGLDYSTKGMRIIRSRPPDTEKGTPARVLSAQDHLTIAEKVLQTHPHILQIFDSFSMLCDSKELDGGIGTETRGGGAKLLAQFCRQMANVVPAQKSIVVGIVHLMANTSGFGAAIVEKSGNAVQYQLDTKLKAKSESPWKVGEKVIGQVVTWEVVESALGPPGRVVESYIRYGVGVDDLYEAFILGEQLGLIEKSGSWYNLSYLTHIPEKMRRAQGGDKAYQLLKENPDWAENLRVEINKLLGVGN